MDEPNPAGLRRKPHILFIGPGNTNRTQIAEAYMRQLAKDMVEARSGGMKSQTVDRRAIKVLSEDGLNISDQTSKLINAELLTWADIIITISIPQERFKPPIPNGAREKPWTIAPPQPLPGHSDELEAFRHTRDEVKKRVKQLINNLRLFKS